MKKGFLFTLVLISAGVWAQDKPLNTQTVTVTKTYTPAVKPAKKIVTEPVISDSLFLKRLPVQMSQFSAPVASTFSPAKGKAEKVQPEAPEKVYNSRVEGSVGNFANVSAEAYTRRPLGAGRNSFSLGLSHQSAQGDILDNPLSTQFSETGIEGGLHFMGPDNSGQLTAGIQRNLFNWYGFDRDRFTAETLANSEVEQGFFVADLSGQWQNEEIEINGGFGFISDDSGSEETRVQAGARFEVEIEDMSVQLSPSIDWVQGQMAAASLNELANGTTQRYSQAQGEVELVWSIKKKEWDLRLGAAAVYNLDRQGIDQGFSIYPRAKARYPLQKEKHYFVAEASGGLRQNSYAAGVEQNPFVSPTLVIRPSQQQFHVKGGLQGLLASSLTYQLGLSAESTNDQALFLSNPLNTFRQDQEGYAQGNSFQWVYDDVRRLGGYAELQWEPTENWSFRTNWRINEYSTDSGSSAWNLPQYEGEVSLAFRFLEKWMASTELFVIGEREDLQTQAVGGVDPADFPSTPTTLESILDLNASLEYQWTPQWSFFVQGRNLTNQNYQYFARFPAQGAQILGGARYRFDF